MKHLRLHIHPWTWNLIPYKTTFLSLSTNGSITNIGFLFLTLEITKNEQEQD